MDKLQINKHVAFLQQRHQAHPAAAFAAAAGPKSICRDSERVQAQLLFLCLLLEKDQPG